MFIGEPAFPDWLFLIRGVLHLHQEIQSPTYDGALMLLVSHGKDRWIASHSPEHANSPLLRDLQDRINELVTDSNLLQTYNTAIDELRMQLSFCLSVGKRNLDLMDAFVWQVMLADSFLPLLRDPAQETIVIFAHFCVVLNCFEGYWWMKGWGITLMTKVWDLLDSVHRPWVQWAIEEISWIPP